MTNTPTDKYTASPIDAIADSDKGFIDDASDVNTTKGFVWSQAATYIGSKNLSNLASASTARTNLGVAIGVDVQAYSAVLDGTTASFTTTDETKLDGIETGADVTDATNVAAAGAVMDGDFSTNGIMTRTASGTYTSRTISAGSAKLTVTNGDGVSGNPSVDLGTVNLTDIEIDDIASSTLTTLDDFILTQASNGVVSGFALTDGGSGTLNVASGEVYIRATDSDIGDLKTAAVGATSGLALTNNSLNYIYVEYNAGTPQVVASTTFLSDVHTNVILGVVYRNGTSLYITNGNILTSQLAQKVNYRLALVEGLSHEIGVATSETGTRNLAITAGTLWLGLNSYSFSAFDSSSTDRFTYFYRDGASGWTAVASQAAINNTQYDNNSGTLATLTNNKFGVHWVYVDVNAEVYVIYGQGDYTLAEAEEINAPNTVPGQINKFHATLAAKIIIQKSASSFSSVQNAFVIQFSQGQAGDHGELSGLSDDDHAQYSILSSQAGGPSSTPSRVGAINIDTTNDRAYVATDTASSADWDKLITTTQVGSEVQAYAAALDAVSGTNTGDQNLFATIAVSGQSNIVADSATDTLTLAAGTGITITTDAGTDTVTITATGGGTGDVVGPASSTDNAIARFDSTTGKLLQNSSATIDDSGNITANDFVGAVMDSDIGSTVQAFDAGLTDIAGLAVTDGNIIVGDGVNWVAESGATARTSLGLGTSNTPQFAGLNLGVADAMTVNGSAVSAMLQINSDTQAIDEIHTHNDTAGNGAVRYFARSRGTEASPTVVSASDTIGTIAWVAYDGTDYALAARIDVTVDGTPGNNDMPAKIDFKVSPDGSHTPASAMSISNDKTVDFAGNITTSGTIDGRDVAADGTKLDGIETGADVTDATNVAAAGAVMDGDFSTNGIMTRTASGTYTSRTISAGSAKLTVTNGDGVSGNPTIDFGSVAVSDLSDGGTMGTQNATSVNIDGGAIDGTTIGGSTPAAGTFTNVVADTVTVDAGTGSGTYLPSGKISINVTPVGNVGTGEDDLMSYTLPADSLSAAGKGVRITAWGDGANNANAKTVKLYVGGTQIRQSALLTNNSQAWEFVAYLFSTGTDTQAYYAAVQRNTATSTDAVARSSGTLALDDGATIVIKCTGEAVSDDDILQNGMLIEFFG